MLLCFLFYLSITFLCLFLFFFFFNDTATTEIYTLSLHDALPIRSLLPGSRCSVPGCAWQTSTRSEEHTSELQSPVHLVCRLLLEKKKNRSCGTVPDKKMKQGLEPITTRTRQ